VNLYLGNGVAIVPLALADTDETELAKLRRALLGHDVVGVPAMNLRRRGGGLHCITQQQPSSN
jgi:agmatine deiminase